MVPVWFTETELEAELARGALQSEGIDAQVRFAGRAGYPPSVAGTGGAGIGAPLSAYDVLVSSEDVEDARRVLGAADAKYGSARRPWRTWLLRAIALFLVSGLLLGAVAQLRALF